MLKNPVLSQAEGADSGALVACDRAEAVLFGRTTLFKDSPILLKIYQVPNAKKTSEFFSIEITHKDFFIRSYPCLISSARSPAAAATDSAV